jgi:HipA-like protein
MTVDQDALLRRLGAGAASSAELVQLLGASQSTIARLLRQLVGERRALRIGTTRGARYALRRAIEEIGDSWPLHRIDRAGNVEELGQLHALAAGQYFFEPAKNAVASGFAWGGISEGLPYFLQDQRPAGFLGRAVPFKYPELRLPQRVVDWNDDHYLRYLTQRGADAVGDLILGTTALDEYLRMRRAREPIRASQREDHYPQSADLVMQGGLPGSLAHGEHPKFAALVQDASGPTHVLVKFSPPLVTAAGVRWSDLLIAEHHAHAVLQMRGLPAARSRILQFAPRTYLEVERFDRESLEGRVGVSSLFCIDAHLHAQFDNWIAAATRLNREGHIDSATLERVRLIDTFGALIANTDRHFGNLAFYDDYRGTFQLAPVYDMLPMLFAPQHDQVVPRSFVPPGATADTLRAYADAREIAAMYWQQVAADERVSQDFRAIAAQCGAAVAGMAGHAPAFIAHQDATANGQ